MLLAIIHKLLDNLIISDFMIFNYPNLKWSKYLKDLLAINHTQIALGQGIEE